MHDRRAVVFAKAKLLVYRFQQTAVLLSLQQMVAGSRQTRQCQSSRLFGALVQSRVSSVNVQLDIPDLLDSPGVVIPTFHKPNTMEVRSISALISLV